MALKDRIATLMDFGRKAMVAATASSAAVGGGAVAYKAVTTDPVVLEAVAVPSSLEEQGYSPEIATQRILDELASLNRATVSAKDRTSFGDKRLDLANLDAGIAGLDLKQAIGILRELFGKTVHRISGEITQRKEGETVIYRVRLRQTPERTRLVEFEAKGDPDHLFCQVALKLLEAVDPHVAAAVYWNRLHDRDNALRLIDVVLNNDTPADDKYSLNLRAQMAAAEGRLDDALADAGRAMALDPNFPAAYANTANFHRMRKDYAKAREAAEKAIALGPNLPYGYGELGRVLRDMKEPDQALVQFSAAIARSRQYAPGYNQAGLTLQDLGKEAEALGMFAKGVAANPEHPTLRWNYGRALAKAGRPGEAVTQLEKAVALDPDNPEVLISLAEAYGEQKQPKDAAPLLARLRALASGQHLPPPMAKRIGDFLERHKGA